MKRHIFQKLKEWKRSKRRKPLILQGMRQVGKTYALDMFAKAEYENAIRLNFEDSPSLKQFFEQDLNPHRIIKALEIQYNTNIISEKTLVILDEIQECPNALNSLKYFNEHAKDYHVCAAGSLLGVVLANGKGFPVGQVNFLQLYPLNFMEFLEALGETKLKTYLQSLEAIAPLPTPFHDKLINLLKTYLFTGGMPEAVITYIETENLHTVREVQKEIIRSYHLDFSKHASGSQTMKIVQVWNSLPSQLAKENKKFLYSVIRKSARAREYEGALQWLEEAGIVYKTHHVNIPNLPLKAHADLNTFKLYLADVGILNAIAKLKPALIVEGNRLFKEFKGSLTENFIAQELKQIYDEQFYWASQGKAELDFLLQMDHDVYPVEVKAGSSKKKKSLRVYEVKYRPKILLRASLLNLKFDGSILNIPLYLIGNIEYLLTTLLSNQNAK